MFDWERQADYYSLNEEDLGRAFAICANAPFVNASREYSSTVSAVHRRIESDEMVNAYAWVDHGIPNVAFTTGMMRWLTAASIVATRLNNGAAASECRRMFKWCAERLTNYKAGSDFIERFCVEFDLKLSTYDMEIQKTYAIAMAASVYGHELGHLCLHHCTLDSRMNHSVSRNDERQADLFAASIITSNGASELNAVAAIMSFISLKWLDGCMKSKGDGMYTHPADDERIRNFVNAFAAQLSRSRITAKTLLKIGGVK